MTTVSKDYLFWYLESERDVCKKRGGYVFPWLWEESQGLITAISYRRVTSLLSRQYVRIFKAAGCEDLSFHDLRHEATSRIYERTNFNDIQIARITGHKTLITLKRYANLRGSDASAGMW
jgi:integrase